MIEIGQLLIALFSGTIVSGLTLFRWGIVVQKLSSDLNEKIEMVSLDLKEQNKVTMHALTILKKDLCHSEEITNLQTKNEILLLQNNYKILQARLTDIERYLSKTNGFKLRNPDKETRS